MSEADQAGARPPEAVLRQAETLLRHRDPAAAESLLRPLLAANPGLAPGWNALGRALNNLGRVPESEQAFSKAAQLSPDYLDAWLNLAHVRRRQGRLVEAETACGRAMELARPDTPEDFRARRLLASVCLLEGRADAAVDLLGSVLVASPDDPAVLHEFGDALRGQQRLEEALEVYLRCLQIAPDDHDARAALGIVQHGLDQHDAAAASFRQVLAREPGHTVAREGLIWTLEIQRDFEGALGLLQPILSAGSPPAWAVITAGRLLRRLGRHERALTMLETADMDGCSAEDRATIHATRGEILDDAGRFREAFEQFRRANACLPGGFDPQGYRQTIDRLAAFFTAERMDSLPRSGVSSDAPVFIVGMPRSGTSLIEQILGSHPRVEAGGERTEIYRMPRRLAHGHVAARWPECLLEVKEETLEQLADNYLQSAPGWARAPARITDKLPANYLNLGLIQLLLPAARVIWCRRDPMDTGLSCFQQNFRSEGMDFARDLGHIGLQQQGCRRLMEHWQRELSLPIHAVDYEQLIEDPEGQVRQLLAFAGLDWDEACLNFHRSRRVIRTASYEQVRQPIYKSSIGRWRHYEPWLAPLAAALEAPWISPGEPAGH
ncbi:MAG: sulfotransferase [Gammaproteobacteria bacterium]|jgi:tetratricopeptide (TPR) repeat protein